MPTFEIKMPKLGESITEGVIISWSVKEGDIINEDDILFEVNTAKVSAEIPSPVAGKVLKILFKEGDTVPIGTAVAIIELEGEGNDEPDSTSVEEVQITNSESVNEQKETKVDEITPSVADANKTKNREESRWYSPVVNQLAQEAKISAEELDQIPGTGYMGRLSKNNIKDYIGNKKSGVSPAAKSATTLSSSTNTAVTSSHPTVTAKPVVSASGSDEIIPMDAVGRIIADRMVESKKISAHVTTIVETDVTKLVKWRSKNKDTFKQREGINLTYMPAIVEATVKALKDFPKINASVDGYNLIIKKQINMGVAVSLDNGNLIVPVIKDVDKLNLSGIAASIDHLAIKARSNKLSLDDIQGGTFTITNFGSFKNIIGTPIINQPEIAILGAGLIEKKPAVISTPDGDVIAIRHKMYLSLTYDHRAINGAEGGAFVQRIADYLENWED